METKRFSGTFIKKSPIDAGLGVGGLAAAASRQPREYRRDGCERRFPVCSPLNSQSLVATIFNQNRISA
jgi:hypothetical protein